MEDKHIPKILKEPAMVKKKSTSKLIAEDLFPEDFSEVIGEAIRNGISDIISDVLTSGAELLADSIANAIAPGSGRRSIRDRDYHGAFAKRRSSVSIRREKDYDRDDERYARRRHMFDYDEFVFKTRADAVAVLTTMDDMLDKYGVVSVRDLYDICQRSTDNYMTNKYGWSNLSSARVVHVRNGYVIDLPKAMLIDMD